MGMPQLQNLGLSGIAWTGVDIGGFFGDGNGELLARWTEFGIFQPFCRNHTAMGTVAQEPWAFGEPWETVCRAMLQLRMQLVPYLYTLFEECHRTGAPILRPLLFAYQDDPTTYTADEIEGICAYCQEIDSCYYLPIEIAAGRRGFHLRLAPAANHQELAVNWAAKFAFGAIAQMGERGTGSAEVAGSSPASSTS